MNSGTYAIKPFTPVSQLDVLETSFEFPVFLVSAATGMSPSFIKRAVGRKERLDEKDVRVLLDQDAFGETFVPRSRVLQFLRDEVSRQQVVDATTRLQTDNVLVEGDALDLIPRLPDSCIDAVVTSTPYWAMRVYDTTSERVWADGEVCGFGLEQTPEGFIRHSVEILFRLLPVLKNTASVWWNIMDSYNTRTQIRSNAAEALYAMQGKENLTWSDHQYRRYSAGHAYLQDGEQCLIPQRIAERASRVGYLVKSTISWCKSATTPEPQLSRVSRNVEYVLHLTKQRTPEFHKDAYLNMPTELGGKQSLESEKLSDFWYLPTSSGRNGHGAQFPLQLPGRCIGLSTSPGGVVLDPFMGSGTTALAAKQLGRHYVGFDISSKYLHLTSERLDAVVADAALR